MIHEEICTYEVSLLAKEKGFPLQKVIKQDGRAFFCELPQSHPDWANCDAWYLPTQSQLQRWLREKKGIYIEVYIDWEDSIEYNMIRYSWRVATIYRVGNHDIGGYYKNESEEYFDTYELALEDALKYIFKNLV